jgi:hypothetical protein
LLSICDERSRHASDALVDVDPVDDWLCAASSVFRVAGDICEPAPDPEAGAELVEAEVGLAILNGSTALKPLDGGEDAPDEDPLDEVNALTASSAAVAAPRANSMS